MTSALVSVCIPTLGREEKLERLLSLIPQTVEYEPYEVIVEQDVFGPGRQGCPKTLVKAVERAAGDYIVFLGNDCVPRVGWLKAAMRLMQRTFLDGVGCAGFNDMYWPGPRCLHWVAHRGLLSLLDGYFFCPEYNHVGVDDEMIARLRKAGKYKWCYEAIVEHDHFTTGAVMDAVYQEAWKTESVEHDRALLKERAERFGFTDYLL